MSAAAGTAGSAAGAAAAPAPAAPSAPIQPAPQKELTREQLLDFIKKMKIKLKKAEMEKETLEEKLLQTTTAVKETMAQSPQEPCLYWEMIHRESPFQQNLAKTALRSLLGHFSGNRGGGSSNRRGTLVFWAKWKSATLQAKLVEAEQKLDDSQKAVATLEQRCVKLKGLLSRTHQANKQQVEDTNAFKRAQQETTQELRTHAQEKLALIEEVRSRDIEAAFHQDLELYIQKAAEGVMSQHQQLQLQLQTQSQSAVSKSALKELEDENAKLAEELHEVQNRETDLATKLKECRQQMTRSEKASAAMLETIRELELKSKATEKQIMDEKSARRDLEVELDITLRSRADILRELETASETKLARCMQESNNQIELLTNQCAQAEKSLAAALASSTTANEENAKLRRSAQLMDNTNELVKLRARISEYKKLLKSGTIVTLQGGEQTLRDLLDQATFFARHALQSTEDLQSKVVATKAQSKFVVSLYNGILKTTALRLAPFVPPNTPLDSQVQVGFDTALLSSAHLQKQQFERSIEQLKAQLLQLSQNNSEPMVWEASSVTIQAGRDISFAIPMPSNQSDSTGKSKQNATLEWSYSGEQASVVSLTLSKAQSTRPNDALSLQSVQVQSHGNKPQEFKGKHDLSSSEGDRILKLSASSMWGQVSLSYFIRLTFEKSAQNSHEKEQLVKQLETETASLRLVSEQIEKAQGPLRQLFALFKKLSSINDFSAEFDSSSTSASSFTEQVERIKVETRKFETIRELATKGLKRATEMVLSPSAIASTARKVTGTKEGSSTSSGGDAVIFEADASAITVLNCESLSIRASDDFRVYIPPSLIQRPFRLQWNMELISKNLDIGFTILEQQDDGALPTIIPYRRIKGETSGEIVVSGVESTLVVLLDNTYSWARAKQLKCSIQVVGSIPTDSDGSVDVEGSEQSPAKRLNFFHHSNATQKLDDVFDSDSLNGLVAQIIGL